MPRIHLVLAAALAGALPAAPILAQASLHETHAEIWHPSGKLPQRTYRPLAKRDCAPAHRHHQSGKSVLHHAGATRGCTVETAARDATPQP